METISVIVRKCTPEGDRVYGDFVCNSFDADDLDRAIDIAKENSNEGFSVIIRPNFNEEDEKGRFFREWRSFNGSLFKEVRFQY